MQKNTTDDEMGWAAHKKWLLIFLSKFCLRLCGDFCLLFFSLFQSNVLSLTLILSIYLVCFTHTYSYFVCALPVQAQYSTIVIFFLPIRYPFVRWFVFFSFYSLFFVRFVFVVSSSCCSHRWWFSIQFIFGSLLLLLLPFLFFGCVFVCVSVSVRFLFHYALQYTSFIFASIFCYDFSFFSATDADAIAAACCFFGQWRRIERTERTSERANVLANSGWGRRYAMNPLLNDDKNGKAKWKTKTDNIITTVCNFKHCREDDIYWKWIIFPALACFFLPLVFVFVLFIFFLWFLALLILLCQDIHDVFVLARVPVHIFFCIISSHSYVR